MFDVDESEDQVEIIVKLSLNVPKSFINGPIATDELQEYLNYKLNTEPEFFGEIDAGCIEILE